LSRAYAQHFRRTDFRLATTFSGVALSGGLRQRKYPVRGGDKSEAALYDAQLFRLDRAPCKPPEYFFQLMHAGFEAASPKRRFVCSICSTLTTFNLASPPPPHRLVGRLPFKRGP